MKKTKFCLSLLLGTAVLMISACEKQENKVEATPKVEVTPKVEETQQATKQDVKKEAALLEENKEKTSVVDQKSEAVEQEKMVEAEKTVEMTTQQKMPEDQVLSKVSAPAKIKQTNDPNIEKRKILQILEQQYHQVRCTPEGEKLGSESFCHQEEYRLLNEIDRLKKELR